MRPVFDYGAPPNMTQREFVAALAARTGLSQARTRTIVKAAVEIITERLRAGESVRLASLGVFSRTWRNGRTLRDVASDQTIYLDGRFSPHFKPATALRTALESLTPQLWRDPAHQDARRRAAALIASFVDTTPDSSADDRTLRAQCAALYGNHWEAAVAAYDQQIPATVRESFDHLAAAVRDRVQK